MINHGKTQSLFTPDPVQILETSVMVAKNIREIELVDETGTHTGFEFDLIQYEKDEYIKLMDEKNAELEQSLTDTQLALCDVYEMIGG